MNRGLFVTVDGPGGAGKTTVVGLIADILTADGMLVHNTTQPSRTDLGNHIRNSTHTYQGMALACLVAGDRHHQLVTEIIPALANGAVILCDRYLPSSLVLQRLDGLSASTIWQLNTGVLVPDTAVLLTGDPEIIEQRLRARGTNSRFEQEPGPAMPSPASTIKQPRNWPTPDGHYFRWTSRRPNQRRSHTTSPSTS